MSPVFLLVLVTARSTPEVACSLSKAQLEKIRRRLLLDLRRGHLRAMAPYIVS